MSSFAKIKRELNMIDNRQNEIFKTLSLISQIGISVIVPIGLLVALGMWLRSTFNIDIMLILIILGVVAGIRNAVTLINGYLKSLK